MTDFDRPDSFCARVHKGRYFPDLDFMHANTTSTSSMTWQAIIAGREASKDGFITHVGEGSGISVWEDKWISDTISMKPIFKSDNTTVQLVNDLIDIDNWKWKNEFIREIFLLLVQ